MAKSKEQIKQEKVERLNGYRSMLELYFSWWLDELKEKDLISSYTYEEDCFTLSEKNNLLRECVYTPDFNIMTTEAQDIKLKILNIFPFVKCPTKDTYLIEIKPTHNYQNKNTEVMIKVKWLYDTQAVYVNIVKPIPGLFKDSFTPIKYQYTDTTFNKELVEDRRLRKINWDVKLLNDIV